MKTFKEFLDESKSDPRGGDVSVGSVPGNKWEVIFTPYPNSPRGRTKPKIISSHNSSEEASKAADEYAKKHSYDRLT